MNAQPLDDLEMHELLRLIYPDHIRSDDDEYFYLSADIAENCIVDLGDGFEVSLADLLGRVVMLTTPLESGLTRKLVHALGKVIVSDSSVQMHAVVKRAARGEK